MFDILDSLGIYEFVYIFALLLFLVIGIFRIIREKSFAAILNIGVIVLIFVCTILIARYALNISFTEGFILGIIKRLPKANFYAYLILISNLGLLIYEVKYMLDRN